MKQIARLLFLLIVLCLLKYHSFAQSPRINFGMPDIYPEGVAYSNKTNLFYVSSVRTGTIGTVTQQGVYSEWYKDTALKSTFGIKIDDAKNCLWVCAGNPNAVYSKYTDSATLKKEARLVCINLLTKEKIADVDLSELYAGKHFLNDLTLDDKGNIYVTDSYSPVVYRVDKNKKAFQFATSTLFKGEDIALNGIAWNKGGFIIVVNSNTGAIIKIDADNSSNITRVKIDNIFSGADGIWFTPDNHLIISQNKGVNKISELVSSDNWQTAKIVAATSADDRFAQPSTIAAMGGKYYVLNSKLNELSDPTLPKAKDFSLQLAVLKPL